MAGSAQPQRPVGQGLGWSTGSRRPELTRMVETQIIPRLMLAHRGLATDASGQPTARWPQRHPDADRGAAAGLQQAAPEPSQEPITPEEVAQFARAVLAKEHEEVLALLRGSLARGVPLDCLLLDLIAPAARLLGRLWEEDLCSFTEVTVGVGRLQAALREVAQTAQLELARGEGPWRILLSPAPGEQHTLGLSMVEGFFRRAGWEVAGGNWSDGAVVPLLAAAEWFDVVGFSIGSETLLDLLANTIRSVRHASCNPQLVILVGGSLPDANPRLVHELGADALAADARHSPALAADLLSRQSRDRLRAG